MLIVDKNLQSQKLLWVSFYGLKAHHLKASSSNDQSATFTKQLLLIIYKVYNNAYWMRLLQTVFYNCCEVIVTNSHFSS